MRFVSKLKSKLYQENILTQYVVFLRVFIVIEGVF